ncbi:septum site-determining protein Ssd [Psychromicrobium sp. YIM B11713]|uniref:septum site-determining protein Ssd n=1 Tax=Psychromicrobium sp. YIM B11713 TaxID=3145233 RepID=UPI00374EDAE8
MRSSSSTQRAAVPMSSPVYLRCSSEEVRAQVELAVAAAGAQLTSEISSPAPAVILIGMEELSASDWRRAAAPVLLIGSEHEEAELWSAAAEYGIDRVVPLPKAKLWLAEFLNSVQQRGRGARVIAILGGCGGAGASTLAALLAAGLSNDGRSCLLLDGDPWGFGLERALSPYPAPGLSWQDLAQSSGSFNPRQLAAALPELAGCRVLGFGGTEWSIKESPARVLQRTSMPVLEAARSAFDLVLLDVGRLDELRRSLCAQADLLLILLPATLQAVLATRRLLHGVAAEHCFAVVRLPAPEGLDAQLIAESLGLPLLGSLARIRGLGGYAEQGELTDLAGHRSLRKLRGSMLSVLEGASP